VTRILLVGAGEVGAKHLRALAGLGTDHQLVGVADPSPSASPPVGVPVLDGWKTALDRLKPDAVIVATPPGTALLVARGAAERGARVLVEKPATLDASQLGLRSGDDRIFVAFQPHFAPGVPALLADPPVVARADVILRCQRDRSYYRGWRAHWDTCGGVLHQQAIHGLALVVRLLRATGHVSCTATVRRDRGWGESEDQATADLLFTGGRSVHIDARVDSPGPPCHHLLLHLADGGHLHVRGRNLEAGVGDLASAPSHLILRRAMYEAWLTTSLHQPHPALFPLRELRHTLQVIDSVYACAPLTAH
jgi:predicted dehydrogenase